MGQLLPVDAGAEPNEVTQPPETADKDAENEQKQKPKRRLRAAFFLLGMGMYAFTAATSNSTDYFARQYQGLEPMRAMSLIYSVMYMLAVFLQFFTPNLWPDKRARMFWGFVVFICSVLGPALVEGLLNEYQSGTAVRYGFIAWAVGAAGAGAADAVVATVVNGEASACGCNKHASLGRPACGLLMVSLRCIIKATIHAAPGDMLSMRKSASAHVLITVALLVACVLVVTFALPRLVQQVADVETVVVPPGLTFQQTLNTAISAYESGALADEAMASLRAAGNLAAMQPGIDSLYGLPMFSIRQSSARGLSFHHTASGLSAPRTSLPLSSIGSVTAAQLGLQARASQQQQQQQQQQPLRQSTMRRYVAEHASSFPHKTHSLVKHDSISDSSNGDGAATAVPIKAVSGRLQATRQASFAGSRRLVDVFGGNRTLVRRISTRRNAPLVSSAADEDSQLPTTTVSAQHEEQSNKDPGISCSADAATVQTRDQTRHDSGRFAGGTTRSLKHSNSSSNARQATFRRLGDTMRHHMSDITEDSEGVHEDLGPSPFHSLQLSGSFADSAGSFDEGRLDVPLLGQVTAINWAIARRSWFYLCVAFTQPIISGQIRPIAGVRANYADALGRYYNQVLFFAQTVGSMIGSQVLPTYLPERRRRRLLAGLTSVLLLFIPAFACVVHLSRGPEAFIPLVFVLFTHAGYVNSSVFSLAYDKLDSAPDDGRTLQMIMALTTALSNVVASCLAFLWTGIRV